MSADDRSLTGEGVPYGAIAEFTYDWESWISQSGKLLWTNEAVQRLTGYSVAECEKMTDYPLTLVADLDRPLVERELARAASGEAQNHIEFRIQKKDGTTSWGAISYQPIIEQGRMNGFRTSVRDIDQRKKMEDALRVAVRRAESADRTKSAFLANVSHELKTPLQSICGYAELIARELPGTRAGEYAETVGQQGRLLERLVKDLLEFSSLQTGALSVQLSAVQPPELVGRVLQGLQPLALARQGQLSWSIRATESLMLDPDRVAQVLTNLVGNAIKFATPGTIRVTDRNEGERWVLVVSDNGPGVSSPESLFRPFSQLGQAVDGQHKPEGVGLGLSISREICHLLGGELRYQTAPSGGACFEASFAREIAAPASQGSLPVNSPHAPRKILVVDDVASSREVLAHTLRSLGHEALEAASADQAFGLAEEHSFDAAFVDLQMPGVDGFGAARGLRARLGPGSQLIAMSAGRAGVPEEQLHDHGFERFIEKPITVTKLRSLLGGKAMTSRRVTRLIIPPGLDRERWKELSAIKSGASTLLDKMKQRVLDEIPPLLDELLLAREQRQELGSLVHQAGGLLALIGASDQRNVLALAEQQWETTGEITDELWERSLNGIMHIEQLLSQHS